MDEPECFSLQDSRSRARLRIFIFDSANSRELRGRAAAGQRVPFEKNFLATLARFKSPSQILRRARARDSFGVTRKRIVTLFIFGTGLSFAPVCTGTLNSPSMGGSKLDFPDLASLTTSRMLVCEKKRASKRNYFALIVRGGNARM